MSINLYASENQVTNWRKDYHSAQKYRFIHHFLPHPEGKHRATLLTPKSLFLYCLLVVVITGIFRFVPKVFPNVLGYATNINVNDLLKDTNKIRAESGLSPLKYNNILASAAQKKAQHMFKNNYWAHVAPDGTEPWDFILGENYDYLYAGENLAKNFSTSDDVVDAWYNSPSHKENLLNKNYTEIGFAIQNGTLNGYETTLVVQMFGKPRAVAQVADVNVPDSKGVTDIRPTPAVEDSTVISKPVEQQQPVVEKVTNLQPLVNVKTAVKWLTLVMGGFVAWLLVMDIWYSSKKGIVKLGGHTFVHLTFLILAMVGIWVVLVPGSII